MRELGLDLEKVNVNGGAIALGHPLGMSGSRLVTMLVHELQRRTGRYGLATMCIGVGQGIATLVETSGRGGSSGMTASWNDTDEVGWPAGADGSQDPEPFRPDWSSFEDSLRAHGFEVVPPAVDATAVETPAAEGLTSDGMSRAAVEEASRAAEHNVESEPAAAESDGQSAAAEVGAEPTHSDAVAEPTHSDASAEPVSASAEPATVQAESGRSNDFWSFETDEPTWIVADDVEDPASTGATAEPDSLSATVDTAPASEDTAPTTENVASTGVAYEPATAASDESGTSWDGFDDADAPVLPDVGQPVDHAPLSVFGEEAAPASAGAVFHADELADEQLEDVSPDASHSNGHEDSADRWWTEPEDVFGTTDAVAEAAPETEDSLDRRRALGWGARDGRRVDGDRRRDGRGRRFTGTVRRPDARCACAPDTARRSPPDASARSCRTVRPERRRGNRRRRGGRP